MDPFQVEIISQRLIRDVYSEGAQIHMCAVAAIEIACWDIIGKACNQPVYNLWGGRCHEKLRAYANGWYRGPRTPESFAAKGQDGRRARLHGAQVRSVRQRLALPFALRFRSQHRYHPRGARRGRRCRRSADRRRTRASMWPPRWSSPRPSSQFRPAWFEEPVPHTNIAAMVEVARRSPVPIATGESLSTKQQFAELLKHDAVSILQPEPLNLGGLFATRKIADMVDAHYGVIAPHSAQGPVCSAACVQLNASIPNFFIHEIFDEFNEPWEKEIVHASRRSSWTATSRFRTGPVSASI